MENSKRVFEKISLERIIHYEAIDISHLLLAMLAKKHRKLPTEPGLKLTLTVTELKTQ